MTVYLCSYDDVQEDFMPDEPKPERPTRAAMDALTRKVALLETLLATARQERDEVEADRNRWREERAPDGEAEAIAGCVRALEEFLGQRRVGSPVNGASYQYGAGFSGFVEQPSSTPIGRVLLHLAARYGVPLEPPPPPVFEPPAERLIVVPVDLANQLENAGQARQP